jgi:light-regulated signal transduction histidine kinase (bacteriophytochrome)
VGERTCQLQSALTELEAFNYTVSHDLKSPLRSIDAYCQFIQEDYKEVMDPEILKMVVNIQNISRDMVEMIKKLLGFSSKNHFTISKEELNMKSSINTVFEELRSSNSDKPMKIEFQSWLPSVQADRVLMWELLSNVLSNSIKFAKKDEELKITVSCEDCDNEYIFSIKDNGVGFDMDYSSKLFGVFQRLHSQDEYEGSGIGLATVRKIIQLHSGRVWIEGKVSEGTTLYFTLPKISAG